eukprot:2570431-Karenia_brevis.AAC.1
MTEEDKEMQDHSFSPEASENKRKSEEEDEEAPKCKRRRTQEEENWNDDFWTDADRTDRNI